MNLAWHFVKLVDGKPVLRDGRPLPEIGEWLEEAEAVICERGLHASWQVLDALKYRPSGILAVCLVEVDKVANEYVDKFVCHRRRIIDWIPCNDLLRLFARKAAQSVLHLLRTQAPEAVLDYLETGDETIRQQAYGAAYAVAVAGADAAAAYAADAAAYDAADAAAAYASYAAAAAAAYAAYAAAYDAAADAAAGAAYAAHAAYAAAAGARQLARAELNTMLESMLLSEMDLSSFD